MGVKEKQGAKRIQLTYGSVQWPVLMNTERPILDQICDYQLTKGAAN